jgi:hypothetical protein
MYGGGSLLFAPALGSFPEADINLLTLDVRFTSECVAKLRRLQQLDWS